MALRHVIKHEFRLLRADRVLGATLVAFLLLFAYALMNGATWVRSQERTLAALDEAHQERVASVRAELQEIADGAEPASRFRDPRLPSVLGGQRNAQPAGLPPGPLGALAVGQSDLLPFYHDVSIYTNEQSFLQNGEVENPLNLMVGRFDLAFVMVYLLPLLVLALSYNVLSGERERGTLALTLSQPVSARSVVAAKLAFRALVVLALALGASVIGGLAAGVDGVGRLMLWSGVVAAYALFWLGLAAWVNALGRSSAWNATVLVGAWLLLVVVVPATLNLAAGILHPLPSRVEMITVQREASNEAVNRRSELLARYLEDHPEMAGGVIPDSVNTAALSWAATDEVNRRLEEVTDVYEERLRGQRTLVQRYRYASPALLAHSALLETAGTGDGRFDEFERQVRAFAEEWKAFFVPPLLAGEELGPEALDRLPAFSYREEPPSVVRARVLPPLLALLLFTGLVMVPALGRLNRVRGAG